MKLLIGLGLLSLLILTIRPKEFFEDTPAPTAPTAPTSTVSSTATPLPIWALVLIIIFFIICLVLPLALLFLSPRVFFGLMFLRWLF